MDFDQVTVNGVNSNIIITVSSNNYRQVKSMTIDEKLQHFYEVSLDEAREDAARAIQDHKDYLQKVLEEHRQSRTQTAEAEVKAETEHVRREVNKALSSEQITLKRNWSLKQNELKETLFAEVKNRVQQFTATPEYQDYLCRRIREAKDFAEDDEILIFLSSNDKELLDSLTARTGCPLQVSSENFLGGIRAEIPAKNILIDNSFAANLAAMHKEFKFDGGLNHE